MSYPRIMLATLCLNEYEWLPKLYEQHKDWPGLVNWVFVESADAMYALTNPNRITPEGLSVDPTTEFLRRTQLKDTKVIHIKAGIMSHNNDPAQGKCASRNLYWEVADQIKPDLVFVLDADEFYTKQAQHDINRLFNNNAGTMTAFCFPQRHIWRPPSIDNEPLFSREVVGGFWGIPHCRGWRWSADLRHKSNHNTPETMKGYLWDKQMFRGEGKGIPECAHMGFAAPLVDRAAKNRYYERRGELTDPKRHWYTESRAAFETWTPGVELPRGAKVISYTGPIPECWR